MSKVPFYVRLDPDLVARVKARADELGQSLTVFAERALEAALSSGERGTGGGPGSVQPPSVAASPRTSRRSSGSASAGVPTVDGAPKPGPTRATKSCVRGCAVPVANPMKRCVPHGLPLREAE